jgi:Protein of unknown function (DUF2851)
MTERLLQYIWQFQYYNKEQLVTESGDTLQIIHPGQHNTSQGPDFLEAKIKLGSTLWAGSIEIHVNSSDWKKHRHGKDVNYKNVVLHVVWRNDAKDDFELPVLVLSDRVAKVLLWQYDYWMLQPSPIPCSDKIEKINELVWASWKERLLVERLQRKSDYVLQVLHANKNNWEETCWQLLARNFGTKINEEAFERIAHTLPLNYLSKHRNQLITMEALLLGRAGLLKGPFTDEYPRLLFREYNFQCARHRLSNESLIIVQFLRMRPASFPTIRLAQLAALLYQAGQLFSKIKEAASLKEIIQLLEISASDYWNTHYLPDTASPWKEKRLGKEMVGNIIVNTIVPLLFSYGLYYKDARYNDKALAWLMQTSNEKNKITKSWTGLGIANRHAYDSQSLVELTTRYCNQKKCLDCAVGNAILKRTASFDE